MAHALPRPPAPVARHRAGEGAGSAACRRRPHARGAGSGLECRALGSRRARPRGGRRGGAGAGAGAGGARGAGRGGGPAPPPPLQCLPRTLHAPRRRPRRGKPRRYEWERFGPATRMEAGSPRAFRPRRCAACRARFNACRARFTCRGGKVQAGRAPPLRMGAFWSIPDPQRNEGPDRSGPFVLVGARLAAHASMLAAHASRAASARPRRGKPRLYGRNIPDPQRNEGPDRSGPSAFVGARLAAHASMPGARFVAHAFRR